MEKVYYNGVEIHDAGRIKAHSRSVRSILQTEDSIITASDDSTIKVYLLFRFHASRFGTPLMELARWNWRGTPIEFDAWLFGEGISWVVVLTNASRYASFSPFIFSFGICQQESASTPLRASKATCWLSMSIATCFCLEALTISFK